MSPQEVKGSGIIPIIEYIQQKKEPEAWQSLLDTLPDSTREVVAQPILAMAWYPLEVLSDIYDQAAQVFGGGEPKVCWDLGRASADWGLGRVYKFFISFGKPMKFLTKCPTLWKQYYRPSTLEVLLNEKGHGIIQLKDFHTSIPHLHSIGGWCVRAAELTGGKEIQVSMDIDTLRFDFRYK